VPAGGFAQYDQSDSNHILGLGPSSSSDGFAFYTADTFPIIYRGKAFIARWAQSVSDAEGNTIDYADVIAVDPITGIAQRIALGFTDPIDVLEDGFGNLYIVDFSGRVFAVVPEPSTCAMLLIALMPLAWRVARGARVPRPPMPSNVGASIFNSAREPSVL